MDQQETKAPGCRLLIATYQRNLFSRPLYALLLLEDRLIAAHISAKEMEQYLKNKAQDYQKHGRDWAFSLWEDTDFFTRYLREDPDALLLAHRENFCLFYEEIDRVQYAYSKQGRAFFENDGMVCFYAHDAAYYFSLYFEQDGQLRAVESIFLQKAQIVE